MSNFFPTLPPAAAPHLPTPRRHNGVLYASIFGVVVILIGGAAAAAYMKSWWPFQSASENANVNMNTNVTVNASVDNNPQLALLAQVQQAHFAVQYTGTEPTGASVNSEGDITVAGDFQYTAGIVKFPKEHSTNDPRDGGLETIGMMYMGSSAVRVGSRDFVKINVDALLDANILTEEVVKSPDMQSLGAWQENTYASLHFFPMELYYLQNFANLTTSLTKVDEHTWKGTVDADVAKASVWQIERWKGDRTNWRFTSEAEKQQEFQDWSPPDITTYPTFTLTTTATGTLEKVVFTNLFYDDTITTFSRFDVPVTISVPDAVNNPDVDPSHLNSVRADAAGFIARALVAAYAGKSFPQTTGVVRLDAQSDPMVKTILNDLTTVTVTHSPYTTRALEKAFWVEKFVDPDPSRYYYGYSSSDGKSFRLTFIQQQDGNTSALHCNSEKADCVETIAYPEDAGSQ